jgi:DNA-binding transcriptional ArsR family regulator
MPVVLIYNIFVDTNISQNELTDLANVFRLLGQPNRIRILLVIGSDQACVCHIEAVLGIRQATISQHLKALREAGLVITQRDGRNIFYRLSNPILYDTISKGAEFEQMAQDDLERLSLKPVPGCPCPYCNPGIDPELTCQKMRSK